MIDIHPTNPSMNSIGKSFPTVVINGLMYTIMKSSDVIETKSKTGVKSWRGYVVRSPMGEYSLTSSWFNENAKTGKRSVEQFATPYPVTQKNVGRANQTDVITQAYLEFESMVKKELDKRNSVRPLPMLAEKFSERAKYIQYPAAVQPKFDGMRMLYNGETGWSRGNKELIKEVIEHLHFDTQELIIDGELILPDNPTVNVTSSATKKFQKGVSDQLVYRVYDIVSDDLYLQRYEKLERLVASCNNPHIILAETHIVSSSVEVDHWHMDFCNRGFEGTIIRNLTGKYEIAQRSNDLQKSKDFETAEFRIIDIIEAGGGSSEGVGKFICEAKNGNQFESTATGPLEIRKEYLTNKNNYIGKYAVVKFRELSGATQVPFHSNVLDVREKGDF
jgi:hypothetical protein